MARLAVSVGALVATALLAGCAGTDASPAPTDRYEPLALVANCPPGFITELAAFVGTDPVGDDVPDQIKVVDVPGDILPELLAPLSRGACGAQLELVVGGDIHVQDVVVTAPGVDAAGDLLAAGWTQAPPDTEPWAYSDDSGRGVAVHLVGAADGIALGFPSWTDYFQDAQEVLVTSPVP